MHVCVLAVPLPAIPSKPNSTRCCDCQAHIAARASGDFLLSPMQHPFLSSRCQPVPGTNLPLAPLSSPPSPPHTQATASFPAAYATRRRPLAQEDARKDVNLDINRMAMMQSSKRQTKQALAKALADDATVFQYDEVGSSAWRTLSLVPVQCSPAHCSALAGNMLRSVRCKPRLALHICTVPQRCTMKLQTHATS